MKITVITVCFNAKSELVKTCESVKEQASRHSELEHLIIDGGSSDGTIEFLLEYSEAFEFVKYYSEPDDGIYDAMNKGLKHAAGDVINFLNAGDTYVNSDVLCKVAKAFMQDVDVVYGDIFVESMVGESNLVKASRIPKKDIHKGMCICHQALFARVSVYPLHKLLKFKGEWLALKKMLDKNSNFVLIDEPLVVYKLGGFGERFWLQNLKEFVVEYSSEYGKFRCLFNINNFAWVFLKMTFKSLLRVFKSK